MITFDEFCHKMYLRNCEEREGYKDVVLSYEEYLSNNEKFLLDKYSEMCDSDYRLTIKETV